MRDDHRGSEQWWWKYTGRLSSQWDVDTLWARQNARYPYAQGIHTESTPSQVPELPGSLEVSVRRRSKYLVPLLGAAVAGLAVLVWGVRREPALLPDRPNTYTTTNAQRASIQLADGSTVVLGNASILKLSPRFNISDREVTVIGEAYFTVTNHTAQPFVVRTGATATRVLGTTFSVRNYPRDTAVQVAVLSGRVSTAYDQGAQDAMILTPGDLAYLGSGGSVSITRPTNIDHLVTWTSGMLVFRNVTLRDVIPELERFYDVTIVVNTPDLLSRRLSATFVAGPPSEVLGVLAAAIGANSQIEGKRIVLSLATSTLQPARSGRQSSMEVSP